MKRGKSKSPQRRTHNPGTGMDEIMDTFQGMIDGVVDRFLDRVFNTPSNPGINLPPPKTKTKAKTKPSPPPYQPPYHLTTWYDILHVSSSAPQSVISASYKALSKQYHPDLATGNAEKMKDLNRAYEILSDPVRRQAYDRLLKGK